MSPASRALIDDIQIFDEIDSTNAESLRQIGSGKTGSWIVLAESQSAGRGRRGRPWLSEKGAGIYLSMVRQFELEADALQALSLVTAISVQVALSKLGVAGLQLKWPNDVLHQKMKLAGILLELQHREQTLYVVFGIGINVALSAELRLKIDQPVTDLNELTGTIPNSNDIVAAVIDELCANLQLFVRDGFVAFMDKWNELDCYRNSDIVVQNADRRTIGRSLGVDESGALIVQSASGTQLINGGEIFPSLRESPDDPKS